MSEQEPAPNSVRVEQIKPQDLFVSNTNERFYNAEPEEDFVKNIKNRGIIQPPVVREEEEDGEIRASLITGQRRARAAVIAGLESIEVIVVDWSNLDAMINSVSSNGFQKSVSRRDRALALWNIWSVIKEEDDESPFPSTSQLANEISSSQSTVNRWCEPLRPEWEDTFVDPRSGVREERLNDISNSTRDGYSSDRLDLSSELDDGTTSKGGTDEREAIESVPYDILTKIRKINVPANQRTTLLLAYADDAITKEKLHMFSVASNNQKDLEEHFGSKISSEEYQDLPLLDKIKHLSDNREMFFEVKDSGNKVEDVQPPESAGVDMDEEGYEDVDVSPSPGGSSGGSSDDDTSESSNNETSQNQSESDSDDEPEVSDDDYDEDHEIPEKELDEGGSPDSTQREDELVGPKRPPEPESPDEPETPGNSSPLTAVEELSEGDGVILPFELNDDYPDDTVAISMESTFRVELPDDADEPLDAFDVVQDALGEIMEVTDGSVRVKKTYGEE